jgi:hypothetical protein
MSNSMWIDLKLIWEKKLAPSCNIYIHPRFILEPEQVNEDCHSVIATRLDLINHLAALILEIFCDIFCELAAGLKSGVTRDYSLVGSTADKWFIPMGSLSIVGFAFNTAILPELQVI